MIRNHVTFLGGLTRVGELGYASNGNPYIHFGLARNYSKKNDNGDYENVGVYYSEFTLWGKEALCFAQSDIPLGTILLVEGHFEHSTRNSYVNKDGIQVPERDEEVIVADNVAVLIGFKRKVTVENADYSTLPEGNLSDSNSTVKTKPQTTKSSNNKQNKTAKKNIKPAEDIFADTEEDLFADDLDNIDSNDSIFDDSDDTSDSVDTDDLFDDVDADDLFA